MRTADELIYSDDLALLYDAMNSLIEAQENGDLSDPTRAARIVYKFERFVSIHEVRTNDLKNLKEKVEKARIEYRNLQQRYKEANEGRKQAKELLNKVLTEKIDV